MYGSKVGGRDVRVVWRLIGESRMTNLKVQTSSDSRQVERGMCEPNGELHLEECSVECESNLDLQQSTGSETMERLSWMRKLS